MSQVKKLQSGGSLRKDGRTLTGAEAYDWLNNADPSNSEAKALIQSALNNGAFVDITANGVDFYDKEGGNNLNAQYMDDLYGSDRGSRRGAKSTDSAFRRNVDALFNNRRHQQRVGFDNIASAAMPSAVSSTSANTDSLIDLGKGNGGWWEYGEDNKYLNTPDNIAKMNVLDQWADYLSMDEAAANAKYSLANWGDNIEGSNAIKSWWKSMGENAAPYMTALKQKIQNGEPLSEEEIGVLKSFGFNNTKAEEAKAEAQQNDSLAQYNITPDA